MSGDPIRPTATLAKESWWDPTALVQRTGWRLSLTGGHFDGRTKWFATRREARGWADEFGYAWRTRSETT